MFENTCPKCKAELSWDGRYLCEKCQHYYAKVGQCPDCDAELEKLQACGAASYFCNGSCNELKSKSRVKFQFRQVDS